MNTIVENKSKLDELVQEGYKIIYPNSIDGLDFEVIIKGKTSIFRTDYFNTYKRK